GQLERRTAEASIRVEQVARRKSEVEYELERVREQLQTPAQPARNPVNRLRSAARSNAFQIKIRRPHLRWAPVLAVLVAVNLLGLAMVLAPDQPGRAANNAPAAVEESPAPVSLLPSTASDFAMFDMPAGRAYATTGTIAATKVPSVERSRETPAA